MKLSTIMLIILIFTSCALKPYRATLGISSSSTSYSKISEVDGKEKTDSLCVESVSNNVGSVEKCSGGGYKTDQGISSWEPTLEFMPSYFGGSSFGWSYFFAYNSSKTTLLNYPEKNSKIDIKIERISLNPLIFYNIGDKFIKNGSGLSLRVGFGAALNYIYKFHLTKVATGEEYNSQTRFKPGFAAFLELSWRWFTLRAENSTIEYDGEKFSGSGNDTLKIENTKAGFYYGYYF